jgi:hypothetical protein
VVSDTEYQTRSGVFEYMQWFVERFQKGIPFTNSVDEGYRCIMAAWRAGKQLFLQPVFARSDRKFNTREVNRSSTVASDRSGNERAVNLAKRVGVLKRGLRPNESPKIIADVWLAWGFQKHSKKSIKTKDFLLSSTIVVMLKQQPRGLFFRYKVLTTFILNTK